MQVEALAQHVKRLRAAGWHLQEEHERAAAQEQELSASLAGEREARRQVGRAGWLLACFARHCLPACPPRSALTHEAMLPPPLLTPSSVQEAEVHEGALQRAQAELGSLTSVAEAKASELAQRQAEAAVLRGELEAAQGALRAAEEAQRAAAAEGARAREQVEELEGKQKALSDMQQQAQQYNSELQQYNSRMQAELQARCSWWAVVWWWVARGRAAG